MKLFVKRILAYFPSRLPVGMTEFNTWADSIVELTGPLADKTSMMFALASILIHADSKHGALPKKYFVDRLIKSAANQVASQIFQDIKAEQELQKQQLTAEATPVESVASNDHQEKIS